MPAGADGDDLSGEPDRRGEREDRLRPSHDEPTFDIHFDDAPTFYVNGDATHPNGPDRTDPAVRQLERDVWTATAPDPYAGGGNVPIAEFLADSVGEQALHMVNADPKRTPTFTMFGNPDFFFQTTNLSGGCAGSNVCVNPGFAWNHGDVQSEIANTWVGFVGPGVQSPGSTRARGPITRTSARRSSRSSA